VGIDKARLVIETGTLFYTMQAMQNNPRLVAQSALSGSQSSATRAGNAVNTLAPSVITQ